MPLQKIFKLLSDSRYDNLCQEIDKHVDAINKAETDIAALKKTAAESPPPDIQTAVQCLKTDYWSLLKRTGELTADNLEMRLKHFALVQRLNYLENTLLTPEQLQNSKIDPKEQITKIGG
jgi:hypothetical protein